MFEYFRGWKRLAGLITLVLACVLSAVWFRSDSANDTISIPISHTEYLQFASSNQRLIFGFIRVTPINPEWRQRIPLWMTNPVEISGVRRKQWRFLKLGNHLLDKYFDKDRPNVGMGRDWKRIQTGSGELTTDYQYISTMYWWFVIPLTMLSGWLLLSKRRQQTKPKLSPVPAA